MKSIMSGWSRVWTQSVACLLASALRMDAAHAQRVLPNPIVRDSAGIRIAEYPTLGPVPPRGADGASPFNASLNYLPDAFKVETKPYLDIGGMNDNEDQEFDVHNGIFSAVELSDGTLVVNDRVKLKFFSRQGKFIRAVGVQGNGPGEFHQIAMLCKLRGDTMLVVDFDRRRSLWDANGKFLRAYAGRGATVNRSCGTNGSFVVPSVVDADRSSAAGEIAYRLQRLDGTTVRELGKFPPYYTIQGATIESNDDELYVGVRTAYEFRVLGEAGKVRRLIRLTGPMSPITSEKWRERYEPSIPLDVKGKARAERLARGMALMPRGNFPAFEIIQVDPAKRVWISDYESNRAWTVFDSTGRLLGRYNTPGAVMGARSEIVLIASDHIGLLETDGDGALHVRLYRIAATSGVRTR